MDILRRQLIGDFYESMLSMQRLIGPSHDAFLRAHGLSGAQAQLLYFLSQQSPCAVKEVASTMCTTSGAATQLIEGLVKMGIIERSVGQQDRRYVDINLTAKGLAFFQRFKEAHLTHLAELLKPLSNEELQASTRLKRKISEAMLTDRGD